MKITLPSELYGQLATRLPAEHFVFMNHGYLAPGEPCEPVAGFHPVHRFSINLLRFMLRGLDLAGARVLEVGSGRGGNCAYLATHTGARRVTGIDLSQENVEACRRVHVHAGLEFQQGDAQALPLAASSVDCVLNVESSHCYPDLSKFFAEVRRVLRPGGAFRYTDIVMASDEAQHAETLARAGFVVEEAADITANVLLALDENRDALAQYLEAMADRGLSNLGTIRRLLVGINETTRQAYATRSGLYKAWYLRNP